MRVDVRTEIVIDRPPSTVAAFAADPTNVPRWYANIHEVRWVSEPPLRTGSQLEFAAQFLGRRLVYTYEVTEYVPGSLLVMRTARGPFPMETSYTWEPTAAGTRMTLRNRGGGAGAPPGSPADWPYACPTGAPNWGAPGPRPRGAAPPRPHDLPQERRAARACPAVGVEVGAEVIGCRARGCRESTPHGAQQVTGVVEIAAPQQGGARTREAQRRGRRRAVVGDDDAGGRRRAVLGVPATGSSRSVLGPADRGHVMLPGRSWVVVADDASRGSKAGYPVITR
ncbi:SRPBCC family protein [Nocardia farcinica]|uniref:SRPBCC family protein n=1 Tax=Nocardia farcinica TaxID=37329 RepID=UPI0024537518|nr:SRPBCC family protein [Nocardia farcinica]